MSRQDLILATIRTAVPAAVGWLLAWLIGRIPAVADVIASIDGVLATSAPGYTVTVLLNAVCVGLVVAVYYWAVRQVGRRWPVVERWLLGSAKQPVYAQRGADGAHVVTSLPDPSTSSREAYQAALGKGD